MEEYFFFTKFLMKTSHTPFFKINIATFIKAFNFKINIAIFIKKKKKEKKSNLQFRIKNFKVHIG